MKPWDLIETISISGNGRNLKEDLIKNYMTPDFIKGVHACHDTRITYGIQKLPKINQHSDTELPLETFDLLLSKLASRELSGNAAKAAVQSIGEQSTQSQWEFWFKRILERDFKCGVGLETFNKVFDDENQIFEFKCQLAIDSNKIPHHFVGKKLCQPKLDGIRILALVEPINNTVTLYSRNGRILENFPHIEEQLLNAFASKIDASYVFDGEIVSEKFNKLMTQVNRKYNVNASDAQFHIFDIIQADNFFDAFWDKPLREREAFLKTLFNKNTQPNLHLVSSIEIDLDTPAGQILLDKENKKNLKFGFEGSMFKNPDAPYIGDRTEHILKLKPFIEVSLKVVGYNPGNGKNAKYFGSLQCEGEDDGKFITVAVSGFTDEVRKAIFENMENVLGQIIEIRADTISQNKDGTYSLRFPRFKCFRGFNVGEKM